MVGTPVIAPASTPASSVPEVVATPTPPTEIDATHAPVGLMANVRKLVAGTGLGQAIQLGALTLLARAYEPGAFGDLGRVQSIATLLTVVVTLQLHLSIPLSRSDEQLSERVSAVETLALLWIVLCVPVAFMTGTIIGAATMLAVVLAIANTYSSVLVLRGRFGALSLLAIARALLTAGLQLLLSLLDVPHGLIVGAIAGELFWALVLRIVAVRMGIRRRLWPARALATIAQLRSFTLFGTAQELVSVAAFYAPVLLFARYFGSGIAGQYVMSSRLVWAPVILLSGSIARVMYHQLGQSPPRTSRDMYALFPSRWIVGALLAGASLTFVLDPLYRLFLGAGWELAGSFIPIQVLWGAVFLLSMPARIVCRVSELQWVQLIVDAFALSAIVVVFATASVSAIVVMWMLVLIAVLQSSSLTVALLRHLARPKSKVTA